MEIKEHEQETGSSSPTCSNSVSQSTEFDSAKERTNLDRPNIASMISRKFFRLTDQTMLINFTC